MQRMCKCRKFPFPHWEEQDCPHLHSIVPARMPEQSNAKQRGDSSVPGDSRAEDSELRQLRRDLAAHNKLIREMYGMMTQVLNSVAEKTAH